ncbi:PREDICTED: uncharacterized protein LOC109239006 [Nicotiana attenuata]|uniref:uncharacterized protein LOC109239006 n=1 Tax=Nicotiana attenuata TaxID=49451 RepID=UPI0009051A5B|nr:PREDICTED: uncharacterized protein LOC109239006 [Nicotiana attenuata]
MYCTLYFYLGLSYYRIDTYIIPFALPKHVYFTISDTNSRLFNSSLQFSLLSSSLRFSFCFAISRIAGVFFFGSVSTTVVSGLLGEKMLSKTAEEIYETPFIKLSAVLLVTVPRGVE